MREDTSVKRVKGSRTGSSRVGELMPARGRRIRGSQRVKSGLTRFRGRAV